MEKKPLPKSLLDLDFELSESIINYLEGDKENQPWKFFANRIYSTRAEWHHIMDARQFWREWESGANGTTEKLIELAKIFDKANILLSIEHYYQ